MKEQITIDQIDQKVKEKYDSQILDLAKKLSADMNLGTPQFPFCYIHKGIFQGNYIEYTTKERDVVKVCTLCVFKAIDKYLSD